MSVSFQPHQPVRRMPIRQPGQVSVAPPDNRVRFGAVKDSVGSDAVAPETIQAGTAPSFLGKVAGNTIVQRFKNASVGFFKTVTAWENLKHAMFWGIALTVVSGVLSMGTALAFSWLTFPLFVGTDLVFKGLFGFLENFQPDAAYAVSTESTGDRPDTTA